MGDRTKPAFGLLTWAAEGQEGGPHHSRRLHVPSHWSGLTIGRGYDAKHRRKDDVLADMISAGLDPVAAALFAGGVGVSGPAAENYIRVHNLHGFEITREQQVALFEIEYPRQEADVRRICHKADVVAKYGATDWAGMNRVIREVLVDLRYRGDYTTRSRRFLQAPVARNDLRWFSEEIKSRPNWPDVPPDRFNRRADFVSA